VPSEFVCSLVSQSANQQQIGQTAAKPIRCRARGKAAKQRQKSGKKKAVENGGKSAAKCKSAASRPNGQAHPLPCKREGGRKAAKKLPWKTAANRRQSANQQQVGQSAKHIRCCAREKAAKLRQKGGKKTAKKRPWKTAANRRRISGQTAAAPLHFDRSENVLVLAFCSFLMKAD
jgi:hypothetical protein